LEERAAAVGDGGESVGLRLQAHVWLGEGKHVPGAKAPIGGGSECPG
jgi:hypothetical protein